MGDRLWAGKPPNGWLVDWDLTTLSAQGKSVCTL